MFLSLHGIGVLIYLVWRPKIQRLLSQLSRAGEKAKEYINKTLHKNTQINDGLSITFPFLHQLLHSINRSYGMMTTWQCIVMCHQKLKHWQEQHRLVWFVIRTHPFWQSNPSLDSINTGSYLTTYSCDRDTPLCWFGKEQEPKIERTSPDWTTQNKANLHCMHVIRNDYRSEMSMDSVCCSSWKSTVKARQVVDRAIQLVKRGHCDECCECTFGRCYGKGQLSCRCVKWDHSNCISRDGFCRKTRKREYFFVIYSRFSQKN